MKKLIFSEELIEAAVFLDGDLPDFKNLRLDKSTKIIAADGAADKLLHNNFIPNIIIGDMDSIDLSKNIYNNIEILKDIDQETNDFEKILIFALNQKYRNILIFGLHGGELEHTLNNISVLLKYQHLFGSIIILDKDRYCLYIDQSIKLQLKKDELISIIPYPKCKIQTNGLYWELNNEWLEQGKREGARNKCKNENITINLESGAYFLFFDNRYPKFIKFE